MEARTIAGRYRLVERLGAGGMAAVWSAEDLELGRRVAVKLLAADADRTRFEREARALASLAHPNVVRVFDFGESEGAPYMVLELLPGGSLQHRLSTGEMLTDHEVARIAGDVAAGLAAAHERGLVHRDLKPANVLFDLEGRAKIADFGIARAAGSGTFTEPGTVLGTAAYISPEQAGGHAASPASDVYSFGVILYRLLAGRLPFESDDPAELVEMHLHRPPPPISSFRRDPPPALEAAALAALAKRPADRPANGGALLAELSQAQSAAVEEATLALPLPAPRRPLPRVVLAILALLLLAGVGLGVAYITASEDDGAPAVPTIPDLTLGRPASATTAEPPPPPPPPAPTTEGRATTATIETAETEPATTLEPPPPPPTETVPTEPATTETLVTTTEPPPTETMPTGPASP